MHTEVLREVFARQAIRRTTRIALIVGTLVTLINQASLIAAGAATASTWVKVGLNFLLPFCVSSVTYASTIGGNARRVPEAP